MTNVNDNELPLIGNDDEAQPDVQLIDEPNPDYDLMVANYPDAMPLAEAVDVALPEFMVSLQRFLSLSHEMMNAVRLRSLEIIKERDEALETIKQLRAGRGY